MMPLTVRLSGDVANLARIDGLLDTPARIESQRRQFYLLAGLGIMNLVLGIVRVSFGRDHRPEMGYFLIVLALGYLSMVAVLIVRARQRHDVQSTTDATVKISDTGLAFTPSSRQLEWRKLTRVSDVGGCFVFLDAFGNRYAAIAKTELPNEGRDLWRELDDLLVSKRYLVRGSATRSSLIINQPRRA